MPLIAHQNKFRLIVFGFSTPLGFQLIVKTPKVGWNKKRKDVYMAKVKEQKGTEQVFNRGLAFVPFHKVRKTKSGNNILIYLNAGSAISLSIKYLLKVLEDKGEG